MHVAVPFAAEQELPQAPQFVMEVSESVQVPLPSQSPSPAAQVVRPQLALTQNGDWLLAPVGQASSHSPQCFVSAFVLISQPLERASPSQFAYPSLQVIAQFPAAQLRAPFADEQAAPQLPQ
jgi:hypothetical protein